MAKKRKTLPKEFGSLVKKGAWEELKEMMLRCQPNATYGYEKNNALGVWDISEDFARWLVEYGTDINMPNDFGYTPLHRQAMDRKGGKLLELYISLGADVNAMSHLNGGPLHGAADHGYVENIKILLEHGADINGKTHWGKTPLEFALGRCRGAGITSLMEGLEVLIQAGAEFTDRARKDVTRIGEDIEFRRADFTPELVPKIDAALNRLYALSEVPPVPKRRFHDGKSPIEVTAGTWQEQYQELWDYLVPGSGPCQTVQGEVVRINGRVRNEIVGNGNDNWDRDFQKMLKALKEYLKMGIPLKENELLEVDRLIAVLCGKKGWIEELDLLCQLSVKWVQNNPEPMPLKKPDYRR